MTTTAQAETTKLSEQEAYEIGFEAYWYFYPLITMDVTRRQVTNLAPGQKPGFGPANTFAHIRAYPDADFKTVVRPNFDTLYSSAWLDLSKEPMVLSVPDFAGRYYLLPMLDMWTDVFAVPGSRTSGTQAGNYAIVPQGWSGNLPAGVEKIEAPTPYVWLIGRTKTDGPDDYAAVHSLQDGLKLTPLSQFPNPAKAVENRVDNSVDMKTPPLELVNSLSAQEYFKLASELIKMHKPHISDWSIMARLRQIGFNEGADFNLQQQGDAIASGVSRGAKDALKEMLAKVKTMGRPVNGWAMNTDSMGVYGNYYFKRAIVSMVGLGANQCEDAIYPLNFADADGHPLTGENKYVLHFDADKMPPVNAFWSLTMYDADGFQVANSINRFAISSWMPLKKNADGSLDILIQHENPGEEMMSNWLPSPASGVLGITMRLYAPKAAALNGDWNPPCVKKV